MSNDVRVLERQFVWFPQCASEERQRELLEGVKAMVRAQGKPLKDYGSYVKLLSVIVGDGPRLRHRRWSDVPGAPVEVAERLVALYLERGHVALPLRKEGGYGCGLVEVLAFRQQGMLERHVDHVRGVVIVLSLGATANFYYRTPTQDGDSALRCASGDAVMFNSAGSAGIEHGISSFECDKPEWFQYEDYVRVCIQYRQAFD